MAHGENAKRHGHAGSEYWASRLHSQGEIPGRFTKEQTHRKERREARSRIHTGTTRLDACCGCGKPATHECVECDAKACDECATGWHGNICTDCQSSNPVFYDSQSRTHGDVDPDQGAVR